MDSYVEGHSDKDAAGAFQNAFAGLNWQARVPNDECPSDLLIMDASGQTYFATIKAATEGRSDRLVALFAQALLEARSIARQHHGRPAVLIWAKTVSPSLVQRIRDFHGQYADGEAFGVASGDGVLLLNFPGAVREMTAQSNHITLRTALGPSPARLVFSDHTQWMLKLLLAPGIPESLLTAKRQRYRTATDLAIAAGVSPMTASRLVNALTERGFLDRSSQYMKLVMRRKLADLWKASYKNQTDAFPTKFLVSGPSEALMEKLLRRHQPSFLGLFAAADAFSVGHVRGVPPYVYVYDIEAAGAWKELKAARVGETPDLMLKQIRFPRSIGNGAVQRNGIYVSDILQVWLDVSAHPARGGEQAAELEHGVLANVIGDSA